MNKASSDICDFMNISWTLKVVYCDPVNQVDGCNMDWEMFGDFNLTEKVYSNHNDYTTIKNDVIDVESMQQSHKKRRTDNFQVIDVRSYRRPRINLKKKYRVTWVDTLSIKWSFRHCYIFLVHKVLLYQSSLICWVRSPVTLDGKAERKK